MWYTPAIVLAAAHVAAAIVFKCLNYLYHAKPKSKFVRSLQVLYYYRYYPRIDSCFIRHWLQAKRTERSVNIFKHPHEIDALDIETIYEQSFLPSVGIAQVQTFRNAYEPTELFRIYVNETSPASLIDIEVATFRHISFGTDIINCRYSYTCFKTSDMCMNMCTRNSRQRFIYPAVETHGNNYIDMYILNGGNDAAR